MLLTILLLILGLILLIYGGNLVVDGSTTFATRMKIPSLIIGLTIVAFGTSIPELFVTMVSASEKAGELAFSDIIGSNIANTLLILGIAAIICPIIANSKLIKKNLSYLVFVTFIFWLLSDKIFIGQNAIALGLLGSTLLLISFIIFVYSQTKHILNNKNEEPLLIDYKKIQKFYAKNGTTFFAIISGFVLLFFGSRFVVDNALSIAKYFSLTEGFIGLTIVSIGTSLPELATIIIAGVKKEGGVMLGNIIGTNIFNLAFVLGLSGFAYGVSAHTYLRYDIIFLLVITLILYFIVIRKKVITKSAGYLMLITYISYLSYVFIRG